jgi:hypothetical protein
MNDKAAARGPIPGFVVAQFFGIFLPAWGQGVIAGQLPGL